MIICAINLCYKHFSIFILPNKNWYNHRVCGKIYIYVPVINFWMKNIAFGNCASKFPVQYFWKTLGNELLFCSDTSDFLWLWRIETHSLNFLNMKDFWPFQILNMLRQVISYVKFLKSITGNLPCLTLSLNWLSAEPAVHSL